MQRRPLSLRGAVKYAIMASVLLVMFIHSYKCNLLDKWDKNTGESFHSILTFVPNIAVFYLCGLWEQRHKPGAKP